jgi:Zn-dependent peptidase ImmA (M78 family)
MANKISVPHLSYDQIRTKADNFLARYNPSKKIPVPIEEIVEFDLGLNIIPLPGLQKAYDIVAFTSSDFKSINVDKFVLENTRQGRYRFSLAHEVGHYLLHQECLSVFIFNSIEEWKTFQSDFDDESNAWLEFQANSFGGLVLVPKEHLASCKKSIEEQIRKAGMDYTTDAAQLIVVERLAVEFNVSKEVINKRLQKDA